MVRSVDQTLQSKRISVLFLQPPWSWMAHPVVAAHLLPRPVSACAFEEPDACNYSCSSWRGYRTNEMNFRVSHLKKEEAWRRVRHSRGPDCGRCAALQSQGLSGPHNMSHAMEIANGRVCPHVLPSSSLEAAVIFVQQNLFWLMKSLEYSSQWNPLNSRSRWR